MHAKEGNRQQIKGWGERVFTDWRDGATSGPLKPCSWKCIVAERKIDQADLGITPHLSWERTTAAVQLRCLFASFTSSCCCSREVLEVRTHPTLASSGR
jgi:hypothetical protein